MVSPRATLGKGLDIQIDAEIAGLLYSEQELDVDARAIRERRTQSDRA